MGEKLRKKFMGVAHRTRPLGILSMNSCTSYWRGPCAHFGATGIAGGAAWDLAKKGDTRTTLAIDDDILVATPHRRLRASRCTTRTSSTASIASGCSRRRRSICRRSR